MPAPLCVYKTNLIVPPPLKLLSTSKTRHYLICSVSLFMPLIFLSNNKNLFFFNFFLFKLHKFCIFFLLYICGEIAFAIFLTLSYLGFITNPKNGRVKALSKACLDRTYWTPAVLTGGLTQEWYDKKFYLSTKPYGFIRSLQGFYF